MDDAIKKAEKHLLNMSEEEFRRAMKESEDSYLTNILVELSAAEEVSNASQEGK